jgi:hypothetical protein
MLGKISPKTNDHILIVLLTLVTKLITFVYGGQAFQVITDKKIISFSEWFRVWNRWDALAYSSLAEKGYFYSDGTKGTLVFYTLYPSLIKFFNWITNDSYVSGLLISGVALAVAAVLLYELVKLDHERTVAMRAVWFLLIFPTAYFLHVGYSESLFLVFLLGSFYCARKEEWFYAGILGALACLTRANGIVLCVALAAEAIHQIYLHRSFKKEVLWIGLVPLGFILYLAIIYYATGDAFEFFQIRKSTYFISSAPPWVGLQAVLGQIRSGRGAYSEMVGIQELTFLMLGIVCSIISWIKLRPSYSVWITASWLLFASVTYVASIPRYTLALFPVFILFALASKKTYWLMAITIWSLIYYSLFSGLFAAGRWAF